MRAGKDFCSKFSAFSFKPRSSKALTSYFTMREKKGGWLLFK